MDQFGYKPAIRTRKVTVLKIFLNWLYSYDYIEQPLSIAFLKETVRKREKPNRAVSYDEVQQLLQYYKNHPINHAILITLFTTGIRVAELASAKWSDVYIDSSLKENTWYVKVIGKGGVERHVQLMEPVVESKKKMRIKRGLNTEINRKDEPHVFTTNKRKPYDSKYLSRYVTKIIQRTKFEWLNNKSHS